MTRTSIFRAIRGRDDIAEASPAEIAMPAYRPTYATRLRLIGMHLDTLQMSAVKVMEVPGGFLVRAADMFGNDELLEFPETQFESLFDDALTQRRFDETSGTLRLKSDLIPTSYADVLRSIGDELDTCMARSILISEGPDTIYISGMRMESSQVRSTLAAFAQVLYPEDVDHVIETSYRRRSSADD